MIGLQSNGSIATYAAFPKYLDHSNAAVATTSTSFETKRHFWHNGTGVGSIINAEYDLAAGFTAQGTTNTTTTCTAQIVCVSGPTSGVMPSVTTVLGRIGTDADYGVFPNSNVARFTDVISGAWLSDAGIALTDSFSVALEMKIDPGNVNDIGLSKSWYLWGL